MFEYLACNVVRLYVAILFARVVVSFVPLVKPDWSPPDWLRPILAAVHLLTDPPIEFLRRFIPPLRSGAVALDLAFIVWFLIIQYAIRPLVCP